MTRIIVDITLAHEYQNSDAVGLVRVERELARTLKDRADVTYVRFDKNRKCFYVIDLAQICGIIQGRETFNKLIPRSEEEAVTASNCIEPDLSLKARIKSKIIKNINNIGSKLEPDTRIEYYKLVSSASLLAKKFYSSKKAESFIPFLQKQEKEDEIFNFIENDIYITGGNLWDNGLLPILYTLKQKNNIKIITIIYDLIPLLLPEFCEEGVKNRFSKYIIDLTWVSDHVLAISESTKKDFIDFCLKNKLRQIETSVTPLSSRLKEKQVNIEGDTLRSLKTGKFILYVSTIEPRKNHYMLFNIWRKMVNENYNSLLPIVFVGKVWWNSSELRNMIYNNPKLEGAYIKVFEHATDNELAWLYKNARFSVYPSYYEGWGLPVTESHDFLTPCITSNSSSLPEVQQDLDLLISPYDFFTWEKQIKKMLNDDDYVSKKKNNIKNDIPWEKFSKGIEGAISKLQVNEGA